MEAVTGKSGFTKMEPLCVPGSQSARTVVQTLRGKTSAERAGFVFNCTSWNLPNLGRCATAAGASPNERHPQGSTPLLVMAAGKGFLGVVQVLLEAGADATLADTLGNTALHVAVPAHARYGAKRVEADAARRGGGGACFHARRHGRRVLFLRILHLYE